MYITKKRGCIRMDLHYHFVISTERSDEETLMLIQSFHPSVRHEDCILTVDFRFETASTIYTLRIGK